MLFRNKDLPNLQSCRMSKLYCSYNGCTIVCVLDTFIYIMSVIFQFYFYCPLYFMLFSKQNKLLNFPFLLVSFHYMQYSLDSEPMYGSSIVTTYHTCGPSKVITHVIQVSLSILSTCNTLELCHSLHMLYSWTLQ